MLFFFLLLGRIRISCLSSLRSDDYDAPELDEYEDEQEDCSVFLPSGVFGLKKGPPQNAEVSPPEMMLS